jgi:threonine/homoserine/homoserine lactone efflux protein
MTNNRSICVEINRNVTAFGEGVLAGYGIAIPVGAIAILIIEMALRRGFRLGFMAGAGAAAADFLYATLAAVAGGTLAAMLAPLAWWLRVASALVLFGLGGYGLRQARRAAQSKEATLAVNQSHWRTFGQFLGLTLLNPMTVAYFSALILGMNTGMTVTTGERVAFVAGAGLASLSWQTLLAGAGSLGHQRLSPRFQVFSSVIGNLVVIGFGVRILLRLLVR